MGNSFFCNRCDIDKFELSTACADQFLSEEADILTYEKRWKQKLKCLDDFHSRRFGLTKEAFEQQLEELELQLQASLPESCRNKELLIACLERHPKCMLNCKKEMDEFIDCVDMMRVRKIKEKIRDAKKRKLE